MSHADTAMDRLITKQMIKITQLAHRTTDFDPTPIKDSDSSRIVTTIFKAFEPLNQHRRCFTMPNVSNNATHRLNLREELSVVSYELSVKKETGKCSCL